MLKILNSEGQPVVLNAREKMTAEYCERQVKNALGFEISVTTLTTIMKGIIDQKFFEVAPADYLPVRVGEGAWSTSLTTFRTFAPADDFATGIVNTGTNNGRLAGVEAAVDAVNVKVNNWAKMLGWNLMDVQQATKSGNWDIVASRERARKRNWDLGIQRLAFLGLSGDSATPGLLNQAAVTNNTTRITKKISAMTGAELTAFVAAVLDDYRTNCARTAWPTHFIIPESDFLGLAAPSDPSFQIRSKLSLLEETFQTMTKNKGFKILPLAYGDVAYGSPAANCRYVLLNYNEDTLRMDLPVDYTSTLANSVDNFSFQNVAYGQFTGVMAYRPSEILYYSF